MLSLKGFPKKINIMMWCSTRFSLNEKDKKEYMLYIAMWIELLESISNEERKEYIENYKDKVDRYFNNRIFPIEILKEYGF